MNEILVMSEKLVVVEHIFKEKGKRKVILKIKNANEKSATDEKFVNISKSFIVSPTVTEPPELDILPSKHTTLSVE